MMKFPAMPPEKAKPFDDRLNQVTAEFLATPSVAEVFRSEGDVAAFEEFRKTFSEGTDRELKARHPQFYDLAKALASEKSGTTHAQAPIPATGTVLAYKSFSEKKQAIKRDEQAEELRNTVGGRLGVALERITKPLNFDWRTNVALIGGLPAKEVIVSTLGTAYSLGELNPQEAGTLADQLSKEPGWNRLTAFTLLLFVMLYAPCTVTLVVMRRETGSWKWPVFAMAYTLVLAYAVALFVYSTGSFLGIGVS
jgi:ferrous iron transport protein B